MQLNWKRTSSVVFLSAGLLMASPVFQSSNVEAMSVSQEESVYQSLHNEVLKSLDDAVFTDIGIYEILSYYAAGFKNGMDLEFTDRGVELVFTVSDLEVFKGTLEEKVGKEFVSKMDEISKHSNIIRLVYVEDFKDPMNIQVFVYYDKNKTLQPLDSFYVKDEINQGDKAYVPNEPDYVGPSDTPEADKVENNKENQVFEDTIIPIQFVRNAPAFKDTIGHYAESNISNLYRLGIVNGSTSTLYKPNDVVTRAQFSAMLARTLDLVGYDAETASVTSFSDVGKHWAVKEINLLAQMHIVNGTTPTTFSPDKAITRQQAAAMLERYLERLGFDSTGLNNQITFNDSHKIQDYAKDGVNLLANMGAINGKPGNIFDPSGNLTRGQMAKILWNVVSYKK